MYTTDDVQYIQTPFLHFLWFFLCNSTLLLRLSTSCICIIQDKSVRRKIWFPLYINDFFFEILLLFHTKKNSTPDQFNIYAGSSTLLSFNMLLGTMVLNKLLHIDLLFLFLYLINATWRLHRISELE